MFDDARVVQMDKFLRRIFALPITRSTLREIQSAMMAVCEGDQETFQKLMESIASGEVKDELAKKTKGKSLSEFVKKYQVELIAAREVHDRGEFVNFITSDVLTQQNRVVFSNCFRTIDGNECRFITDVESTVQMIGHFVGRLEEASKVDGGKEAVAAQKETLKKIKSLLERVIED